MAKSNHLNVVIVGGSLSGLFAALAIRDLGHTIHVLERYEKEELIDQGAGLRIGPDVYRFLAQYVPESELDASMVVFDGLRIIDRGGKLAHEVSIEVKVTSWGSLYRMCLTELQRPSGNDFVFDNGCTVSRIDNSGDRVVVGYAKQGVDHHLSADLVIGADGPSSGVRECLLPGVQRTYVGYGVWRGLVPESALSGAAHAEFVTKSSWNWGVDFMVLGYPIPGPDGSIEVGKRLVNWVWYRNWSETELRDLMTDADGARHKVTIPMGKMRPEVVNRHLKIAAEVMPPQYAEIAEKTQRPFVQLVTDMLSPQNSFFDGKVVLVGDAAACPRPHVAASTSQAVYHISKLKSVLKGVMTHEQWAKDTAQMSRLLYDAGRELGPVCMSNEIKLEDKFEIFTKRQARLYSDIAAIAAS